MPLIRNDESSVTVFLAGVKLPGEWDTFTGGNEETGSAVKTRQGGSEVALGGLSVTSDVTITRDYDPLRDDFKGWAKMAGSTPIQIVTQTRSTEGVPFGVPVSYSGVLLNVARTDVDQRASTAAREISLVAQIDAIA